MNYIAVFVVSFVLGVAVARGAWKLSWKRTTLVGWYTINNNHVLLLSDGTSWREGPLWRRVSDAKWGGIFRDNQCDRFLVQIKWGRHQEKRLPGGVTGAHVPEEGQ